MQHQGIIDDSKRETRRAHETDAAVLLLSLALAVLACWAWSGGPAFSRLFAIAPLLLWAFFALRGLSLLRRELDAARLRAAALEAESARAHSLLANSSEALLLLDSTGRVRFATPPIAALLDRTPDQLNGRLIVELAHADDRTRLLSFLTSTSGQDPVEFRVPFSDGADRYLESRFTDLQSDPSIRGVLLSLRDVTERRELEDRLSHQAFHDPLTGLANRILFRDRLEHALARAQRRGEMLALFFIDLDDFKYVNDHFGHSVGDEALRKVASRLDSCLRDADTSARLGGDEFAVLLEGVTQLTDIELVAERLLAALSAPMRLRGVVHDFSASIGIALGAGARTVDELIDAADHAMYEAKARGKNQIAIAGPRAWRPSPHEGERRASEPRL